MATDKMAADLDVDSYCLFIYTLEARSRSDVDECDC